MLFFFSPTKKRITTHVLVTNCLEHPKLLPQLLNCPIDELKKERENIMILAEKYPSRVKIKIKGTRVYALIFNRLFFELEQQQLKKLNVSIYTDFETNLINTDNVSGIKNTVKASLERNEPIQELTGAAEIDPQPELPREIDPPPELPREIQIMEIIERNNIITQPPPPIIVPPVKKKKKDRVIAKSIITNLTNAGQSVHDVILTKNQQQKMSEIEAPDDTRTGAIEILEKIYGETKSPNVSVYLEKFKDNKIPDQDKETWKKVVSRYNDPINKDIKDDIIFVYSKNHQDIFNVCDTGRNVQLWRLLGGIDKTGAGMELSKTDVIQEIMAQATRIMESDTEGDKVILFKQAIEENVLKKIPDEMKNDNSIKLKINEASEALSFM